MKRAALFLFWLAFTASCGPSATQIPARAYIENKGSDTIVNLALAWAEKYQDDHPEIRISVTGGGSVSVNRTGGVFAVTPGATITVDAGSTLNLGGTADSLSAIIIAARRALPRRLPRERPATWAATRKMTASQM